MTTFEKVFEEVKAKSFSERTDDELQELLINLRKIRTDVPESAQRRRKVKSLDHLTSKVEEVAKKLGKPVDEVLAMLLQDDDVVDALKGEGGLDEEA